MNWLTKLAQIQDQQASPQFASRMQVYQLITDCLTDILQNHLNEFMTSQMDRVPMFHQKLQEVAQNLKNHEKDMFQPSIESEVKDWTFEIIHNCVCHTLLGFFPDSDLATALHDWSGDLAYGESQ